MSGLLTIYSRAGCHLCDDLIADLEAFQAELGFSIKVCNIDDDAALIEKYGNIIPVVAVGERVLCQSFLDVERLREYFLYNDDLS